MSGSCTRVHWAKESPRFIEVAGETSPIPTVEWSKEEKVLHSKRFECEVKQESISFYIENSNRLDTGCYHIKATNEYGSDCGNLHVTVVDRPGPPIGPVVYQNVERDQIKIAWQPPEDDGAASLVVALPVPIRIQNICVLC